MKTLFVTGGAGFIGSEFIRQAIKSYRIINFDKLTYAGIWIISRPWRTIRIIRW